MKICVKHHKKAKFTVCFPEATPYLKNILTLAEEESQKTKINNRDQLRKVLDTLVTLSSNAVPLRGHERESIDALFQDMVNRYNHGNFLQVLGLVARNDPSLKKWLTDNHCYGTMTSPLVQNEMLTVMNSTMFKGGGQNPIFEKKLRRWFTASKIMYLDRKRLFR